MSYIGNSPGNASQRVVTRKVAEAGQTRFASDSGYATGYVDLIINGVDMVAGVDFNETGDGINIDLVEACDGGENIKIIAWIPRGLSDGYTKPEANALLALKADLVSGKIPSSQLPAYVDDVLEYANLAAFPATGSAGIIYVAQDTNNCYRWSGSAYIVLTDLSSYYTKTQADAKYAQITGANGAVILPSGTTAQRPSNPADGYTRYNIDRKLIEYYDSSMSGWVGIGSFAATGGNVSTVNGYTYHVFNTSGVFQVLQGARNIEILQVAGGGAGGGQGSVDGSGGGGAGGLVYTSSINAAIGSFTVTIGAGGSGVGDSTNGNNGSNTNFQGLTTAIGGGGGGSETGWTPRKGYDGGSGGGGGYSGTGGLGTSGQGNNGGTCTAPGDGGGGGAGSAGSDGITGNGGQGLYYSQFTNWGYPAGWFAGGGGASGDTRRKVAGGTGGNGGGANGGAASSGANPASGVSNTGGGGGGAAGITPTGGTRNSGNGGSGIVIIRYLTP